MRAILAELAPRRGDVEANLARIESVVTAGEADLWAFPELFLSGYRVGDAFHRVALGPADPRLERLRRLASERRTTLVVGAPMVSPGRPGELENVALLVPPQGPPRWQVKRYLPTFGPFEEGVFFTPAGHSEPLAWGETRVGLAICYDAFFPEVARELALGGAHLLLILSASPVTSGRLFSKLLPARAVENALPVLYVNRVGVEDGIVFGGGSGAWDARGEPLAAERLPLPRAAPEEALLRFEVDLSQGPRWRPFRPVLRDVARPMAERRRPDVTAVRDPSVGTAPL